MKKNTIIYGVIFLSMLIIGISIFTFARPSATLHISTDKPKTNKDIQNSISSLIKSKGNNYNFLEDSAYMSLMKEFGKSLLTKYSKQFNGDIGTHFNIGNLDNDNIPELVVYEQRDFQNFDDQGALVLYKYKDGMYRQSDKISMNFDNTAINLIIGKALKDQNALFMHTGVGAHSEMFYLFTLQDEKFVSRINPKKAHVLSVYTNAQIKDIDNDGILEFSVYDIDPSSEDSSSAGSDKINIWYKWDGIDGVKFIKYESEAQTEDTKTDPSVLAKFNELLKSSNDLPKALSYLKENTSKLSKKDNTKAVEDYIATLSVHYMALNERFYKLSEKYLVEWNNPNNAMTKYNLKLEDLNNVDVLNKDSIMKDEKELKDLLIAANNMGLKVHTSEGQYYFVLDYLDLLNISTNISSDLAEYLRICSFDSEQPTTSDAALIISWDELAKRIAATEDFRLMYPYSKYINSINEAHKMYLGYFIFGANNTPAYDYATKKLDPKVLSMYDNAIKTYDGYLFCDVLKEYLEGLKQNNYIVDDNMLKTMYKLLDKNS